MGQHDPDRAVVDVLATLESGPWSGEVWRHTFAGYSYDRRNTAGARWNPPGVEALYVSLDRATALAEAEHMIAVQPLRPRVRRKIHRLHISLTALADLTVQGALLRLGVDEAALAGDDFERCQAVGAAASFLGHDGILVPSARNPGHNIVILFAGTALPGIEPLESLEV